MEHGEGAMVDAVPACTMSSFQGVCLIVQGGMVSLFHGAVWLPQRHSVRPLSGDGYPQHKTCQGVCTGFHLFASTVVGAQE